MKVIGIENAVAKLAELDRKVQRQIVKKGLRAGAKVIQAKAKAMAPKQSGVLARDIKVRAGKSGNGFASMSIGVAKSDAKGTGWYQAAVIVGHRVGPRRLGNARRFVPGNHFLINAIEEAQAAAVEAAAAVWAAEINAASGN